MNFQRLVAPVFIAVLLSIAAIVAVVLVAANRQDSAAFETEKKVVRQEVKAIHDRLLAVSEDNAWWDQSVQHILVKENIDWIDRTLGDSVSELGTQEGVMVLRANGDLIYSNFTKGIPSPHALLDAGFLKMTQSFPQPEKGASSSVSGLIRVEEEVIAFAATAVQTAGIQAFDADQLAKKRPLIIFLSRLNETRLEQMGLDNAISDVHLSFEPTAKSSTPLVAFDGSTAAYLNWDSSAPGSELLKEVIVPAALLMIIVIVAMGRFIRRANRLVIELEHANQAKSAFLASMSHEIRTPLNAIIGFTEMISLELYGRVEGAKNKEYLGLIKDSGEHLLSIINDILDISKLEANRFDLFKEKVDPVHVAESSCRIVKPNATERNITLHQDCEPGELYCDERVMRQVLINLLSNAVKFTDSGGTVSVVGRKRDRDYQIIVRDTGIGMTEEEVQTALSLFGQIQNRMTKTQGGTGLGLPLVCRFMDRLGGRFDIASTPGVGTTITLGFPLYTAPS